MNERISAIKTLLDCYLPKDLLDEIVDISNMNEEELDNAISDSYKSILGKTWRSYRNGNVYVDIDLETGSKIRSCDDVIQCPEFPESLDICISNKCSHNCEFCYAGCTPEGRDADLESYYYLIDQLHPFTEIAVNINHRQESFIPFLEYCNRRNIIVNVTMNQDFFMDPINKVYIDKICGRFGPKVHGIGLSVTLSGMPSFVEQIHEYEKTFGVNFVLHFVLGITNWKDIKYLMYKNLKALFLGYKVSGRGYGYFSCRSDKIRDNMEFMSNHIIDIIDEGLFSVVSFDNLAIEQLSLRDKMDPDLFSDVFQGEDGTSSFYIDLVNDEYALNSFTDNKFPIKEGDDIKSMFQQIRSVMN